MKTYKLQYRNFHHALIEVCWLVLDNFNSDNLVRLRVLTLDDLTESTLTQNIQDQILTVLYVRISRNS